VRQRWRLDKIFHGLFYGERNFAAKQWNATKCSGNRIRSVTYGKQAVQRSENIRNSLGSNYKSAALNQLSYAGVPIRKLFSAS
jgi:hypothetical protein